MEKFRKEKSAFVIRKNRKAIKLERKVFVVEKTTKENLQTKRLCISHKGCSALPCLFTRIISYFSMEFNLNKVFNCYFGCTEVRSLHTFRWVIVKVSFDVPENILLWMDGGKKNSPVTKPPFIYEFFKVMKFTHLLTQQILIYSTKIVLMIVKMEYCVEWLGHDVVMWVVEFGILDVLDPS